MSDLEFYHKEVDPKENLETTPPIDQTVAIKCIWVLELYTPETIQLLLNSMDNLGLGKSNNLFQENLSEKVELSRNSKSYSWINLGIIVSEGKKTLLPCPESDLPEGIEYINLSFLQSLNSISTIAMQFVFNKNSSLILDKSLRENYKSYSAQKKNGYAIYTPESIKKKTITKLRNQLSKSCIDWVANNLPGYFMTNSLHNDIPVFEFITFANEFIDQDLKLKQRYLWTLDIN